MQMALIFSVPSLCPRLQYIANQLFKNWYAIPCDFRVDPNLPPLSYQISYQKQVVFSCSDSQFFFNTAMPNTPNWTPNDPDWMQKDWLGMAFFSLCRAEEYGGFVPDKHGRFPYTASFAYACGMLQEPWIDQWVHTFILQHQIACVMPQYSCLPTLDIDMTHAVLGRPWWRALPAFARSVLKGTAQDRLRILNGTMPDPYDNFDYQLQVFDQKQVQATYFFQAGAYGKYDKNIDPGHPLFVSKVRQVMEKHIVGVHPSYGSYLNSDHVDAEMQALNRITLKAIRHSRQHFLRFSLPHSYPLLEDLGIRNEYSMGYAEVPGFRAGTGRSFFWFNLDQNKASGLVIHPFCIMDVALQYFLKYSVDEALEEVACFQNKLLAVQSTFSFCFHNESLSSVSGWEGWRRVFELACTNPDMP